jgi:hypothetical protein
MSRFRISLALVLSASIAAFGQALKLPPSFDKLAKKASNTVEVSLDGPMLEAASAFLDPNDKEEATAKKLISKLKGLYVHRFEFEDEEDASELSQGELGGLRDQLKAPQWSRVVSVRSKEDGESVDIYVRRDGKAIGGLVILAIEKGQLTVVDIDGSIQPEDLVSLGGHFGIPNLDVIRRSAAPKDREQ